MRPFQIDSDDFSSVREFGKKFQKQFLAILRERGRVCRVEIEKSFQKFSIL
jgi:hypothetical protein